MELYKWGNAQQNCLSSYYQKIADSETIIYGFFEDGKLKFAIEIVKGVIVQASVKYNQPLTHRDEDTVKGWFERFFANTFKNCTMKLNPGGM